MDHCETVAAKSEAVVEDDNTNQNTELSEMTVVEEGKSLIKCLKCDYTSDKVTNCRRHFETMHTLLSVPEQCCGMSFQTKGDYREHRKISHPGGLYYCHLCPAEPVKRKALLVRHMSIHTGIKQHTCKLCGYASPNKFNVKRHMVTHSVGSSNSKTKDAKKDKTCENQCTFPNDPSTTSVFNTHLVDLPDSTTDSMTNCLRNPILCGILNSQEYSPVSTGGSIEERKKKFISHSINDILSRDYSTEHNAGTSSIYNRQQRFPGNQEEVAKEINSKVTCENWSGIDEAYSKGYCYNWSHVSAPGNLFSGSLQVCPYEVPLYYTDYPYNSLPSRIHTPSFTPFSEYSGINSTATTAMCLQNEMNFLSPYEDGSSSNNQSRAETLDIPNNFQQKNLDQENFKVCHEDPTQAVLINQQDSRYVPGVAFWDCKKGSPVRCFPTLDYGSSSSSSKGALKSPCCGSSGLDLGFRPPVTSPIYVAATNTHNNTIIESGGPTYNSQDVYHHHEYSVSETEAGSSENISDSKSVETENSQVEYIPKKLKLSKKFTTK